MFIPEITPIQPVNVIIQQPPGLPLWLTIVVSSLTGAISGILGGLGVEVLKPQIVKWVNKKNIRVLIDNEFLLNLAESEAALRVMKYAEQRNDRSKSEALQAIDMMLKRVNNDSFNKYYTESKEIVFEIDRKRKLWSYGLSIKPIPRGQEVAIPAANSFRPCGGSRSL